MTAVPSAVPEIPTTPAITARDISEYYEINDNDQVGTGAFSRVVTGVQKAGKREKRAIKIMAMNNLNDKKVMSMLAHEKEILRRTRHPNILQLYECVSTPSKVYMVMELMKGDLFEFTVGRRRKLNEVQCAQVMKQLFSAVAYLHNINIVHRDIKLENILVNDWNDIRLADYGLAKIIREPAGSDVKNTPCGTGFYIAPEVISAIDSGYGGITALVTSQEKIKLLDLWSCGVVMYVLLCGRPPFSGQVKTADERRDLLSKIDQGVLFPDHHWGHISAEAKELIARLLQRDSTHRVTADTARMHPWFAKQDAILEEWRKQHEAQKQAQAQAQAQQQQEAISKAQQQAQQQQQQDQQQQAPDQGNGENAASPTDNTTAEDVRKACDALHDGLRDDAEQETGAADEKRADVKVVTGTVPARGGMMGGPPIRRGVGRGRGTGAN